MTQTPHVEKHFTAGEVVRDVVIGMSDGLTVPFALAAGLTGAVASTRIIITAGLAEVAARRRRPAAWRDFMMRFELGLERPDPNRSLRSALTIALSYVLGGLVPLA